MILWTIIRFDFQKIYLFPIKHQGKKLEKEKRKLGFYLLFYPLQLMKVKRTLFFSFFLFLGFALSAGLFSSPLYISNALSFNFDKSNQNHFFYMNKRQDQTPDSFKPIYLFGEIFVSPMTLLVKFAFPRNHNAFNQWNHGNQTSTR